MEFPFVHWGGLCREPQKMSFSPGFGSPILGSFCGAIPAQCKGPARAFGVYEWSFEDQSLGGSGCTTCSHSLEQMWRSAAQYRAIAKRSAIGSDSGVCLFVYPGERAEPARGGLGSFCGWHAAIPPTSAASFTAQPARRVAESGRSERLDRTHGSKRGSLRRLWMTAPRQASVLHGPFDDGKAAVFLAKPLGSLNQRPIRCLTQRQRPQGGPSARVHAAEECVQFPL